MNRKNVINDKHGLKIISVISNVASKASPYFLCALFPFVKRNFALEEKQQKFSI